MASSGINAKIIVLITFCSMLLNGCIQQMDVFENSISYLVIDGFISNQSGEQYVRIYHSAPYNKPLKLENVIGADVKIVDDQGNVEPLIHKQNGFFYTSESFLPLVGRSYQIQVALESGKSYRSTWELMRPVTPIDNVDYEVRDGKVFFKVDFKDAVDIANYYRWRFRGTYSVMADLTGMICYVQDYDHEFLRIESDFFFKNRPMSDFEVLSKDIDVKFHRGYYMEVKQFSISKEAYNYLLSIKTQKDNTGTIFETSNYQIRGNITSTTNSDELILGYFGAASISKSSVAVGDFIGKFPSLLCYPPEPPVGTGALSARCYDCTIVGGSSTRVRPEYWPF